MMGKSLANVRRQPIDRMFIGTHGKSTVERWFEMGHMIKGASFEVKPIEETDGDKGLVGGAGYLFNMTAELPQNTLTDYDFMNLILNGVRNVAIVTGTGPVAMIRLFRTRPLGGGRWQDFRLSILAGDIYNSSMDKQSLHIQRWIRGYEQYMISEKAGQLIQIVGGRLQFNITQSPASGVTTQAQ